MSTGMHKDHGPCTPCELCNKRNPKMKHPIQMKEQVQFKVVYEWLKQEQPTMKETACICLPCVKQIQRNHNNTEFTPRWLPKVPPKLKQSCNIEGCHTTVYSQTSLASPEELQLLFEKRVIAFSIESSKSTIGLCQDHYTQMYAHLRHPTLEDIGLNYCINIVYAGPHTQSALYLLHTLTYTHAHTFTMLSCCTHCFW